LQGRFFCPGAGPRTLQAASAIQGNCSMIAVSPKDNSGGVMHD
jgi:hypothetical protein